VAGDVDLEAPGALREGGDADAHAEEVDALDEVQIVMCHLDRLQLLRGPGQVGREDVAVGHGLHRPRGAQVVRLAARLDGVQDVGDELAILGQAHLGQEEMRITTLL
jgi:hypothetical protein